MAVQDKAEGALMARVLSGASPFELAETAAALIGNPVALLDASHIVTAVSSDYPKDDLSDRLERNGLLAQNGQGRRYYPSEFWTELRSGRPFSAPLLYLRRGRMICGSVVEGRIVGVVMLPDVGVAFKTLDHELIGTIARAWCVLQLRKNQQVGNSVDQELLLLLINDRERGKRALSERCPALAPFCDWGHTRAIFAKGDVSGLSERIMQLCAVAVEDGTAMVCEDSAKLLSELSEAAVASGVTLGISTAYDLPEETADRLDEAKRAIKYHEVMGGRTAAAYYDDYRFAAMLDTIEDKNAFVDARLEKIARWDDENQSDYLPTLESWLFNSQDSNAAATQLHIHKNTMLYRLNRIKELFDIDLRDCVQITSLICGLLLRRLK